MKTLLVLDEALAILDVVGVSPKLRDRFREQAEFALQHKDRGKIPEDGRDTVVVSSGYGHHTRKGFVELVINDVLTQMEPAKATEIGVMLLSAAEAAISDEIVMTLLRTKLGLNDLGGLGAVLLDLREIRQGTRGISRPS